MSNTINPVSFLSANKSISEISDNKFTSGFGDMLKNNINDTNVLLNKADSIMQEYTVSQTVDLHEVMIAAEEANLALNYTMQVRNKVIEAYQEMMRVQV